ncbi:DUF6894 family protein [Rhizobium sp. YIM 134829]|uniref:DUF6894 family protein n=1 Tax=Rhizobium sp. YIM 134829 TaxID=3390453 RepID=UPI00397AFEC6
MPRYYFHLHLKDRVIKDLEGDEQLASIVAARDCAQLTMMAILDECHRNGEPVEIVKIEVCDSSGPLFDVRLQEAVSLAHGDDHASP